MLLLTLRTDTVICWTGVQEGGGTEPPQVAGTAEGWTRAHTFWCLGEAVEQVMP